MGLLSYAPSGLAAAVRDSVETGQRVVVPQTWVFLLQFVAPPALYFVDSRFELFPAPIWTDYAAITAGGDAAAEVLDRWRVDLLVGPSAWPRPEGWTLVHEDVDGWLYRRAASETSP